MHTNQKGFNAVEGMLVLLVIGILSFTSWFVWNAQQNKSDTSKHDSTNDTALKNEEPDVVTIDGPECDLNSVIKGRTYNSKFGYSVCIPNSWELGTAGAAPGERYESFLAGNFGDGWITVPSSKSPLIYQSGGKGGPFPFIMTYEANNPENIDMLGTKVADFQAQNTSGSMYESHEELGDIYSPDDPTKKAAVKSYLFTKGTAMLTISSTNIDNKNKNVNLIEDIAKTVEWK